MEANQGRTPVEQTLPRHPRRRRRAQADRGDRVPLQVVLAVVRGVVAALSAPVLSIFSADRSDGDASGRNVGLTAPPRTPQAALKARCRQ